MLPLSTPLLNNFHNLRKIADGKKVVPDKEVGYDFMLSILRCVFSLTLAISLATLQMKIFCSEKKKVFCESELLGKIHSVSHVCWFKWRKEEFMKELG